MFNKPFHDPDRNASSEFTFNGTEYSNFGIFDIYDLKFYEAMNFVNWIFFSTRIFVPLNRSIVARSPLTN